MKHRQRRKRMTAEGGSRKDREKDGRSRLPVRLTHRSFSLRYQVKPLPKKCEHPVVKYIENAYKVQN